MDVGVDTSIVFFIEVSCIEFEVRERTVVDATATCTGSELLSSARRTFDPFPFEVVGSFGISGTDK